MQLYVRKQFPFSLSAGNFVREYKSESPEEFRALQLVLLCIPLIDQRKAFNYPVVTRFVLLQFEVPPFPTYS